MMILLFGIKLIVMPSCTALIGSEAVGSRKMESYGNPGATSSTFLRMPRYKSLTRLVSFTRGTEHSASLLAFGACPLSRANVVFSATNEVKSLTLVESKDIVSRS
uniref:Secreted protein n=1 Tax=Rhodosorus marinus TaxID=101924 RepID=A0A7S0BRI3_9RHOD